MVSYQKEISAMEYDEDIIVGDLVWVNIFEKHRNASLFSVESEAKGKSIRTSAKIFIPHMH